MKGSLKKIIMIFSLAMFMFMASGCKPVQVPVQMLTDAKECVKGVQKNETEYQVTETEKAKRKVIPVTYKNEDKALVSQAMTALENVAMKSDRDAHAEAVRDSLIGCAAEVVAYLQVTGQISANRHATGRKALGVTALVGGIYATGWALDKLITPIANAGGQSTYGDTHITANGASAGEGGSAGAVAINANLGNGKFTSVRDGSSFVTAEKYNAPVASDESVLTSPFDDSRDGSDNEAGFFN